ncbi:uncharacterized protein LOC144620157 isoform X1 [Crassostrea virginica]
MLFFRYIINNISLIILITLHESLQRIDDCVGNMDKPKEGEKCCTNLQIVDGHCEVCKAGYFGTNCASKCDYPSFGPGCQSKCNCNLSECDFMYGCRRNAFDYVSSQALCTCATSKEVISIIEGTLATTNKGMSIE